MALTIVAFGCCTYSCGGSDDPDSGSSSDAFDVQFTLPSTIDVYWGEECDFAVINGKAPATGDKMMLELNGVSSSYSITNISSEKFSISIPSSFESGTYTVSIKRGDRRKSYGSAYFNVTKRIDFTPDASSTVYGMITTPDGAGVANVVVSDGAEVTTTNADGIYQLNSEKKWGYVFMSVPSGYEAESDGVLPILYKHTRQEANKLERLDFTLNKVEGQDNFKLLILGDMHLANRTNDLSQFTSLTDDVNSYLTAHASEKVYALTLGDMTWDLYWVSRSYGLSDYLKSINDRIKGLQIYHTMGNHDNEMETFSDFAAEEVYRNTIAPTFYSFNIGKVHFVVLDDIDCSKYDGTSSRNYVKNLTSEQISWLRKDLSYVSTSTPLIVSMHAQVTKPDSKGNFSIDHDAVSTSQLFDILAPYKVQFVTGHTHNNYNAISSMDVFNGHDFDEHNIAAVCSSWWWSGYLTPGVHISLDGSPGGYAIWDIKNTDIQWLYKGTGWSDSYQFRSYDLNNVSFSLADVPNMDSSNSTLKNAYNKIIAGYPVSSKNEVLINVWNWSPRWTVTVTTAGGTNLPVTMTSAYDPLHIAALTVKRFNSASITSTPSFVTESSHHFFKVTAPDADTDLVITVKDEFGHTWTENMARPKAFSTDAYKLK
jgi:UDP-2,3-diacylglucosamine pyrophosphatase LpxH